ncbi:unnamed protein product [Heterobilharzia americana]|nr:unnamed protein product [Heterobilharzia americana]
MRSLWILPFKLALATNFFSVLFNIINDCDETYNYWEPLHFISTWGEGGGFQTWEYSPSFALRSYLYLWVFGWPASVSFFLGLPNWFGFLLVRFFLGFISGISSSVLSSVVARFVSEEHHRQSKEFESNKKQILFSFLLSFCACMSPGNFLSSTTLLPSGPCSSLTALMLIFWLRRRYFLAVGCVAFSGLVVWPFAAVLGLPLATYMVITGKFRCLVKSALVWLLLITFPLVAVDSFYFGRFVLAPINILRYNLFPYDKQQTGSASQLYGVEPISFYLKNYILNQNIMCILALLSLIHAVIKLVLLPFRIKKSVEKTF